MSWTPLFLAAAALCAADDPRDAAPTVALSSSLPGAVLYDTTHGPALWAVGATYKAGFDVEGAQFVPFLGSNAPRNFPLRLGLIGARVGERELGLDGAVAPRLEDGFVLYERGALVEVYRTDLEAVEQLFRFADHPGEGELVLRVGWSSDLAPVADAHGVRFDGEHGGVRYGTAVAFDARGLRVEAPVSLTADELVIRVPADFLAEAKAPITVDPLIQAIAIDVTPAVDSAVDVSHDASLGLFFVTWQRTFSASDIDVYGRLFDAAGAPRGDFIVDAGTLPLTRPSNAGIEALDRFFVAGIAAAPGVDGAVVGRTVDLSTGTPVVGALHTVFPSTNRTVDVAGDAGASGPHYFFVASGWDDGLFAEPCLYARRVTSDGIGIFPYFNVCDGDFGYLEPKLAKRAVEPGGGPRYWNILYTKRDLAGFVLGIGNTVRTDMGTNGQIVAFSGYDRVEAVATALEFASGSPVALVVMRRKSNQDLYAHTFRGDEEGPAFLIEPALGVECVDASADSDGSNFVVTYTARFVPGVDERILADTYALEGLELVLTERVELAIGPGLHGGSAVTSTRGGGAPQRFFAAWRDGTNPDGDVRGAFYDTPGPGVPYCTAAPNSVGPGALLQASGSISLQENSFALHASGGPPGMAGIFYLGETAVSFPFGDGFRCIGGDTRRIFPVLTIDGAGDAAAQLDFGQPYGVLIQAGGPGVNYQFWYRDPLGGPGVFNLSNALHVEHIP